MSVCVSGKVFIVAFDIQRGEDKVDARAATTGGARKSNKRPEGWNWRWRHELLVALLDVAKLPDWISVFYEQSNSQGLGQDEYGRGTDDVLTTTLRATAIRFWVCAGSTPCGRLLPSDDLARAALPEESR